MPKTYSVSLAKMIKDNGLEILYVPDDPEKLFVSSRDVNRPGLFFAGYENFFDNFNFFIIQNSCFFDH